MWPRSKSVKIVATDIYGAYGKTEDELDCLDVVHEAWSTGGDGDEMIRDSRTRDPLLMGTPHEITEDRVAIVREWRVVTHENRQKLLRRYLEA